MSETRLGSSPEHAPGAYGFVAATRPKSSATNPVPITDIEGYRKAFGGRLAKATTDADRARVQDEFNEALFLAVLTMHAVHQQRHTDADNESVSARAHVIRDLGSLKAHQERTEKRLSWLGIINGIVFTVAAYFWSWWTRPAAPPPSPAPVVVCTSAPAASRVAPRSVPRDTSPP